MAKSIPIKGYFYSYPLIPLPSLRIVVQKESSSDKSSDVSNVTVPGTEWDKIGILLDLFNHDDNSSNDEKAIEQSIDNTILEETEDSPSELLNVTSELDGDEEDNEMMTTSQTVTVGMAGFCTSNVSIKNYLYLISIKEISINMLLFNFS